MISTNPNSGPAGMRVGRVPAALIGRVSSRPTAGAIARRLFHSIPSRPDLAPEFRPVGRPVAFAERPATYSAAPPAAPSTHAEDSGGLSHSNRNTRGRHSFTLESGGGNHATENLNLCRSGRELALAAMNRRRGVWSSLQGCFHGLKPIRGDFSGAQKFFASGANRV